MIKFLLLTITLSLVSCTDGKYAKFNSFGESRSITCFSGERIIYQGKSTGKISSEKNSDGFYFKEKGTGKLIEVSGNCVLGL